MYEYEVQGHYSSEYGWERLTTEETFEDAQAQLKCYDENEPDIPHRIRRVKKEEKGE